MKISFYPSWWRKHFLIAELCLAVFVTGLLLSWFRFWDGSDKLLAIVRGNRGQLYGTLASIFGSLLGFVITAMSIVLGFSSAERLKVLKTSQYYEQLWEVFTSAIRVLGITTVLWLACLFFDRETATRPVLLVMGIGISFLAVLRIIRCIWVLERIVEILTTSV